MVTFTCERCGEETKALEKCMGCGRKICRNCIKSQKKLHKLERVAICKDCWGKMEKRAQFKAAR